VTNEAKLPPGDIPDLGPPPATGTTHAWSERYGNAENDNVAGVATDPNGNVYIVGKLSGTVDMGTQLTSSGQTDLYVASFKPDGTPRWARRFGEAATSETALAVVADSAGQVYVTGQAFGGIVFGSSAEPGQGQTDVFLLALKQSTGDHVWSRLLGSPGFDSGHALAVDPGNNLYVTGAIAGDTDFGGGVVANATQNDVFVASYSSSGSYRWANRYGGAGTDTGEGIAAGGGAVYVTGSFDGVIDFGQGPRPTVQNLDVFLVSLTTAKGEHRWDRTFGSTFYDMGLAAAVDDLGHVYVTGSVQGPVDLGGGAPVVFNKGTDGFVASYDAQGVHRWSVGFGGPGSDGGGTLAIDAAGNLTLGGYHSGGLSLGALNSQGGNDVLLASFTGGGALRWILGAGSPNTDSCKGVAVDPASNLYVTGTFGQTIAIGGPDLPAAGGVDIFLAKLVP